MKDRDSLIRQLWTDGVSVPQIGAQLGLAPKYARALVRRMGLSRRVKDHSAARARITELWATGATAAAIAAEVGLSKNAVIGHVHRMKLPGRPSPIRRDKLQLAPRPPKPPRPAVAAPVQRLPPFVPLPRPPGPCRFPMWPDRAGKGHPEYQRFCGKPGRDSWCAEHAAVVYSRAAVSEAA